MSSTRIRVERRSPERPYVELRHGLLRVQQVTAPAGVVRLGLLATTALLLGGDEVALEVEVGESCVLELFDVAGTVAYHGRGRAALWSVRLHLGPGARLTYAAEPFVVSDGAEVERDLIAELPSDAELCVRETLVIGRTGQRGGSVRSRTLLRVDGEDAWREDQDLTPALRGLPGMLGEARIVDSLLNLGGPPPDLPRPAVSYALPAGRGTLTRYLGTELAESPLAALDRRSLRSRLSPCSPPASAPPRTGAAGPGR